jgi:hypothetical protein
MRRYNSRITLATVILLTGPVVAAGCGLIQTQLVETAKDKAADIAEAKAIKLGVDLHKDYGIDVAKDSPYQQIMKIIQTEAKNGNGELASMVADAQNVTSISDALLLIVQYRRILGDKVTQGKIQGEAANAAQRTAEGLGALAGLNGLVAGAAYLRAKKFKDMALYVMDNIEAGGSSAEIKEAISKPLPGQEKIAAGITSIVEKRYA